MLDNVTKWARLDFSCIYLNRQMALFRKINWIKLFHKLELSFSFFLERPNNRDVISALLTAISFIQIPSLDIKPISSDRQMTAFRTIGIFQLMSWHITYVNIL